MKGRIRFMTAITPAYAHAYQATCLARHIPAVPHKFFRLPKHMARYPYLPNDRSTTRIRGNDFRGWAIYTDGGTRIVDGETLARWAVIARSPHGRIDVVFGPFVTTEAHLAFSGARTHCDNTVEMTGDFTISPRKDCSCLVPSLPPRLISLSLVPEHTPTTQLK